MYCTKCGQNIEEHDIYCPYCSGKVNDQFYEDEDISEKKASEDANGVMRLVELESKSSSETKNVDQEYEKYKKSILKNQSQNYAIDYDDNDEDDGAFKGMGGKMVIVLIVIAFVTATALAGKYFFFDDYFARQQGEIADQENDEMDTETPPNNDIEEDPMTPREQAFLDVEALNYNIDEVRNNENLKFDKNQDYIESDINTSIPISDEVWKEIEGKTYHYQTAIIKSLVQFNSKWVDYVNNNDRTVISLMEQDSKAYKNVVNFNKEGIYEEFLLFEIGEIRKGEKGYYVWTHEQIKVVEDGRSEIKEYDWIYKLVEGEYDFFISNYYRY